MTQKLIQIPTINDRMRDFTQLFRIWNDANDYFADIRFNFSRCRFLRPNAVAFLGGLARLIESRMGSATFDWDTLRDEAVMTNLCQNGFARIFGYPTEAWCGNSIPYREDREFYPNEFADYLSNDWLGKGWVHEHVSEPLKNAIIDRVLELYVNAFEHSKSQIGVFSCGQYFPQLNELHLTLIDFGMGIPASVRSYLKKIRPDLPAERLTADFCLRWAFQNTHTTKPDSSRGMGLTLLKSFIGANEGAMLVFSNDGFSEITADQESYGLFNPAFEGTVFHVRLICDENHYCLAGESRLGDR